MEIPFDNGAVGRLALPPNAEGEFGSIVRCPKQSFGRSTAGATCG